MAVELTDVCCSLLSKLLYSLPFTLYPLLFTLPLLIHCNLLLMIIIISTKFVQDRTCREMVVGERDLNGSADAEDTRSAFDVGGDDGWVGEQHARFIDIAHGGSCPEVVILDLGQGQDAESVFGEIAVAFEGREYFYWYIDAEGVPTVPEEVVAEETILVGHFVEEFQGVVIIIVAHVTGVLAQGRVEVVLIGGSAFRPIV